MSSPTPKPFRSRLFRLLVFVLVAALVVELALQLLAYNLWTQRHDKEQRSAGDGPVVLCVGDSMSYGLGSTAGGSYPAQLELILREQDPQGRDWVVVNGAQPGRDSAGVLHELPRQLARFAPDFLCLLVGTNDQWSRLSGSTPAPEDAAAADDGFPIVWRTKRLFDLWSFGRLGEHGDEAFVGTWNKDGVEVEFQPTGRMLYENAELRWSTRDGRLVIELPDRQEHAIDWSVDGDALTLTGAIWNEPQVLQRGPVAHRPPLQMGQRALAAGDFDRAAARFAEVLEREVAESENGRDAAFGAREGLVQVALGRGDRGAAAAALVALRERALDASRSPVSRAAGESLAHATLATGDVPAAVEAAFATVRAFPASDRAWEIVVRHGPAHRAPADLVAAIDAAVAALDDASATFRADLLVQRALFVKRADPVAFLVSLFRAQAAGAEDNHVVNHIHLARGTLDAAQRDRAIASLAPAPDVAARWRALFDAGMQEGSGMVEALVGRLEAIIARASAEGAQIVMLDYPFRDLDHERLVDTVAAATGAVRVRIRERFDALLETKRRDDLFIRDDIHCNDAGYRVMAEMVARELLRAAR